jgi:hypothetical protein
MEGVRADTTTPDTRLYDDMNPLNPAITETLTQLMLGGLPTGRVLTGAAWGEDVVENMAPVLGEFFAGG